MATPESSQEDSCGLCDTADNEQEGDEELWLKDVSQQMRADTWSPIVEHQRMQATSGEPAATSALQQIRPYRATPGDLEMLLRNRADPNVQVAGDVSVLRLVLVMAKAEHVSAMRDSLLKYGAKQDETDVARWKLRVRADKCDHTRLQHLLAIEESPHVGVAHGSPTMNVDCDALPI